MREFNERTRTLFSRLQYPTNVVCLVVLWRFRYKLSLWDLAEMSLQRGLAFRFEAVQAWGVKLAPLLAETLPKQRYGAAGKSNLLRSL
jgi:transposase-like protein